MPTFQPRLPVLSLSPVSAPATLTLSLEGDAALKTATTQVPAAVAGHPALLGKKGAKLALHSTDRSQLNFGLGTLESLTAQEAYDLGAAAAEWVGGESLKELNIAFPTLPQKELAMAFLRGFLVAPYRITDLKSSAPSMTDGLPCPQKVGLVSGASAGFTAQEVTALTAQAEGMAFTQFLCELPSRHATPELICDYFKKTVDSSVQVEVWDEKKIKSEGMGLFLAVAQGAGVPPRFLVARYGAQWKGKKPHLALVGKGVTFDTGGINLKASVTWQELLAMKTDMAGASAVLGAMVAMGKLKPEVMITAVTPLTENGIGETAILPGEIVKSMSGKTVEIMNTDAEGRLILADALTFVKREGAEYIVDAATLTGACMIALGRHHSGLFTNNEAFGALVRRTSERAGEPAWPLPLSPRYGEELKSTLADLSNMGDGRLGGASIGAAFLQQFVEKTPWVHLDIAGTADRGGKRSPNGKPDPTAVMVSTFVELAHALARGDK